MADNQWHVISITHHIMVDPETFNGAFLEDESNRMSMLVRKYGYPLLGGETREQSVADWSKAHGSDLGNHDISR